MIEENVVDVLATVADAPEPPGLTGLKISTGLHPTRVTVVIAELVEPVSSAPTSRCGPSCTAID